MSVVVFWSCLALVAWTYFGFPALLWLLARLRPRPVRAAERFPSVSLVVCAHNEEASIATKLENVLGLDYPRDRLEVVVASDGSTDATNAIVGSYARRGVRLLERPRAGKIPALNAAVEAAHGEILAFSDANSLWDRGALRALVEPFADPAVGGVAGDQRYLAPSRGDGAAGERGYWDLDRRLKEWGSRAGSTTSATGAIYAVRRTLFRRVPPGVTDDFWVSTNVIAQGRRLVFRGDAVAREPVASGAGAEFRRKVRIMTRGLRGVLLMAELLDPRRHGFYSLQLLTHKVLRRLVVLPLTVLLVLSPFVYAEGRLYRAAALGQAVLYGLALLGLLSPRRLARARPLQLPAYFCLVNAAAALAAWNAVRGRRIESWESPRAPLPQQGGAP